MFMFSGEIDSDLIVAIGKIAISHNQLDHFLRMIIRTLERKNVDAVYVSTRRKQSAWLRKEVRILAKRKISDHETLKRLYKILDEAKNITDRRNITIHSLYIFNKDGDTLSMDMRSRKVIEPKIKELEKLSIEIVELANKLNNIRHDSDFIKDIISNEDKIS